MSLITEPIDAMSFEVIRDQIAAVLLVELNAQVPLQTDPEIKRVLTETKIWAERFVPLNQEDIFGMVIFFFASRYDNNDPRYGDSDNIFYIDVFGKAETTATRRGDEVASKDLHVLLRIIYKILESPHYLTLGLPKPFIRSTKVVSIKRTEEEDNRSAANHQMYRMIFQVDSGETLEDTRAFNLAQSVTNVRIAETELGYVYEVTT